MPASTTFGGVSKSGSPISRWIISLPCFSSARARFRTSKAVSVPNRDIRPAKRSSNIVVGSITADGIIAELRVRGQIEEVRLTANCSLISVDLESLRDSALFALGAQQFLDGVRR